MIGLVLISACQNNTKGNVNAKSSPIKSDKDASLAVSNFTDSASSASSALEEVSKNLGR